MNPSSAAAASTREPERAGSATTLVYAAIGVVGSYIFLVLPLLIDALDQSRAFSKTEVGLIGAASLLGMFAGSVLSGSVLHRRTYGVVVRLGASGLAAAYLLSCTAARNFVVLTAIQFAGGVAGTILMSMALMAIGRTWVPERSFAIFVVLQLGAGALGTLALGAILATYGITGAYAALAAFSLMPITLIPLLPPGKIGESPQKTAPGVRLSAGWSGPLILLGQFAFGCGVMAIWSIAAIIGTTRGWPSILVEQALSLSLLASIGGALVAAAASGRWPRSVMLWGGALLLVAGAVLAAFAHGFALFAAGIACFGFAWNLMPAFQLALAADLDRSGRLVVLSIAAVKLGYAAGVSLGGLVQVRHGFQANALLVTVALALSTLAFTASLRWNTHGDHR